MNESTWAQIHKLKRRLIRSLLQFNRYITLVSPPFPTLPSVRVFFRAGLVDVQQPWYISYPSSLNPILLATHLFCWISLVGCFFFEILMCIYFHSWFPLCFSLLYLFVLLFDLVVHDAKDLCDGKSKLLKRLVSFWKFSVLWSFSGGHKWWIVMVFVFFCVHFFLNCSYCRSEFVLNRRLVHLL